MNQAADTNRLLYLVGQLRSGGLERQLNYLLQNMDRSVYRPAVAVWNFDETAPYVATLRAAGVPLYPLPKGRPTAKIRVLRRLVRDLKPEVVHSYSFFTNIAAYWGTVGSSALPLGSLRSDFTWDRQHSGRWLGKLSARWPRDLLCNSRTASVNVAQATGFFVPRRAFVVRNGMDLQHFAALPPANAPRACIAGIGSLFAVKRWDRLLRAQAELKRGGHDCTVRIAGHGQLLDELNGQAAALGLGKDVQFLGHNSDVRPLLAESDFLVHVSEREGCPNAVMEAMACGRAVVAMSAGDMPEIVEHGVTGFVVPQGDEAALVKNIATLLGDRELCRRMGEAARRKAEQEFGLDRLVAETLAAYQKAGWRG